MSACWNCGTGQDEDFAFCGVCGRSAKPGADMLVAVDYLVSEVDRWDWMNAWRRGEITADYETRRQRLERVLAGESLPLAAVAATAERPPAPAFGRPAPGQPAVDLSSTAAAWLGPEAAPPEAFQPPPPPRLADLPPPGPDLLTRISGFMEERNIRWIHTLGALLLLAAGIGFLRSQWSVVGRLFVTLSLLLAPIGAFAAAFKLREHLPISSRLLSVLGALLMPTGLLALRVFGYVHAPVEPWNGLSFLACAGVLAWLAVALDESACVYLGAAAAALAAHYFAAATHEPQVFGALVMPVAFALLLASRVRLTRPSLDAHVRGTAHLLALSALLVVEATAGVLPRLIEGSAQGIPAPSLAATGNAAGMAAASAAFYALSAITYLSPSHLYAACACAVYGFVAVGLWQHAALVTVLLTLALGLAIGALVVERRFSRTWAVPLAHCAALLAAGSMARETALWAAEMPDHLGAALLATALASGIMARSWRGWTLLDRTVEDALAITSAVLLPAALLVLLPPLDRLPLVALQLGLAYAAGRSRAPWGLATRAALLLWMPVLLGCPRHANPHLALLELVVPAAAYAVVAIVEGSAAIGAASFALLLPALDPGSPAETRALLLAAFAAMYVRLRRLGARFCLPAWAAAMSAWGAAISTLHLPSETQVFAWWPMTVGLGALWLRHREETLGGLAVVTTLGVAAFALEASPATALPLTLGAHAVLAAWAALRVAHLDGRAPALGGARFSVALTTLLLATLPYLWIEDHLLRIAVALLGIAAAAAAFEPRYRDWPAGTTHAGDWLAHLAALCVPAAALALCREAGLTDWLPAAQLAVAAALLAGGLAARLPHWGRAAHNAALGATVLGAVLPSDLPGLPLVPAALWLVASLGERATRNVVEVVAALVLAHAAFLSPTTAAVQVLASFAAALAVTAVRRRSESDATAALVLLPAGLALLGAREVLAWESVALGTAALGFLTALAQALTPESNVFSRPLQRLSPLFSLGGGALGLALAVPGLNAADGAVVVAALGLGIVWRTRGQEWASHAAYALLHLLLLRNVPEPRVLEWYLVPLGLWLLYVASRKSDAKLETVACLLIGLPWLWTSLIDPSPLQAVAAGVVGVAIFLLGIGRRRLLPCVVGTGVVVAEIALQTHRFLASMPWQFYTTVAGLALITLGVLFERQRQRVMALGARIVAQWES